MFGGVSALLCAIVIGLTLNVANTASLSDSLTLQQEVEKMNKKIGALTRQMMLQQLFIEEQLRSGGQSGIKQIRNGPSGSKTYYARSHVGGSLAAIHTHSNNIRTVGMGEFIGVLNGVEFRTRHNDYRLYMPSTTSRDYGAFEDIPFPPVPPEVTKKVTMKEKVEEMVEWFKAWQTGQTRERDYRKYFKPVLCYLEGTWTKSTKNIDEPFESDRHFIDANSWFDLQEKIRFTSYAGRKDGSENYAYLPTTIMETVNETTAVFAQWNYRIMCHPLKADLPLKRLRMVDDIAMRLTTKRTMEEHAKSRAARFQVNPANQRTWRERPVKFSFLDELMSEIPGKDNYPAKLTDDAFGEMAYTMDPKKNGKVLNAGYYHRWYKVTEVGAMGVQTRSRGFSDPSVFMAMNTQPNVAGLDLKDCKYKGRNKVCETYNQKWSYAIPMEIIYLTPLNSWNPYNITYKGDIKSEAGRTVQANNRNGGNTKEKAFDGINSKLYYLTPNELFSGTHTVVDPADTSLGAVGVLDPTGEVRMVRESGIRIFFPDIPGVGVVRQRYPIMPVHGEGSTVWKKLEAVQDLLMDSKTHARLYRQQLGNNGGTTVAPEVNTDTQLSTGASLSFTLGNKTVSPHKHEITFTTRDVYKLTERKMLLKTTTSEASGHSHVMVVGWNSTVEQYYIHKCSGVRGKTGERKCKDKHPYYLTVLPTA